MVQNMPWILKQSQTRRDHISPATMVANPTLRHRGNHHANPLRSLGLRWQSRQVSGWHASYAFGLDFNSFESFHSAMPHQRLRREPRGSAALAVAAVLR